MAGKLETPTNGTGIDASVPTMRNGKDTVKRAFDLIIVTIFAPVIAPMFLVVAMAIALEQMARREFGPILFTEPRTSKGRIFRLYKLNMFREPARRAYIRDSREFQEFHTFRYLQESPQDLLLVGRLMKKYYLDELAQVINVVLGQMSMVGPRPRAEREPISYEAPRRELKSGIFCFVANRWKTGKTTWLSYSSDGEYLALYRGSSALGVLWLDCRVVLDGLQAIVKGKGL